MRTLAIIVCLTGLCSTMLSAQQVVINEFKNGANIWIEICNLDDVNPASIGGWVLAGYWDNPANGVPEVQFTFPLGTTLNPLEALVVEEVAGASAAPLGTQAFTLPPVNPEGVAGVPWFVGVPLSMALYDASGNGVDYLASGSINQFNCPFNLGGGTPAIWTAFGAGSGVPVLGGVTFGANGELTYRHTRDDSDSPDDWTNTAIGNATPGTPNHFQYPITDPNCNFALPTPIFAPTTVSGCPPLLVGFSNRSFGPCYIDPMWGGLATWDFDAIVNPGLNIAVGWHASNVFSFTGDVVLSIVDSVGNMVLSMPQTITILGGGFPLALSLPMSEDFEAFPPFFNNPCTGGLGPDPATTGWEHSRTGTGRMRRVSSAAMSTTVGFPIGTAHPNAGDSIIILDSVNTADLSRAIVHFDGTQGGSLGFRIRFALYENFDELHNEDTIFLQDGFTPGNRVHRTGAYATVPGHDGYLEMLLMDWNTANDSNGGSRIWHSYEIVVTYAQMAAAGLSIGPDMRLGFSQFDNVTFEGNDGLAFDVVAILPEPPLGGNGQPSIPGEATLDINGAVNANLNPVGNIFDPNGPYFATSTGALEFTFAGQPFKPIILVTGNLAVGAQMFGAAGQVDLSPAVVVSDGISLTGFLPFIFNTDPFGQRKLTIATGTSIPPGFQMSFQAALLITNAPFVRLSNAVEVTF